jgi:undecaprenyl-diphosphatase
VHIPNIPVAAGASVVITPAHALTMTRAIIVGVLQGITELFPISSLGHSVLVPAWFHWNGIVDAQSANESFYLAFIVGLHVATAIALFVYYWRDWRDLIPAAGRLLRHRRVRDTHEHLAWLLIVATIPAGLTGLVLEHALRTLFAKPFAAAAFLTANGVILYIGERLRRRRLATRLVPATTGAGATAAAGIDPHGSEVEPVVQWRRIEDMTWREALAIGIAQIGALFAGISRSGITMVAGLGRGLDNEDAARFSFLLATPIIFAAGMYKLPDLLGHLGNGIRGQVIAGSIAAAIAAYIAVRFLVRFYRSNNLVPFAIYCLLAGSISMIRFA